MNLTNTWRKLITTKYNILNKFVVNVTTNHYLFDKNAAVLPSTGTSIFTKIQKQISLASIFFVSKLTNKGLAPNTNQTRKRFQICRIRCIGKPDTYIYLRCNLKNWVLIYSYKAVCSMKRVFDLHYWQWNVVGTEYWFTLGMKPRFDSLWAVWTLYVPWPNINMWLLYIVY